MRQLLSDLEDIDAVNKQLDQMYAACQLPLDAGILCMADMYVCRGYNMGIRLIDEFLAKAKITSCGDFRETADKIAKVSQLFCGT